MPEDQQQQPAWSDFKSFVAYVRAACARHGAPQPALSVLELEYPQRCYALAGLRAHAVAEEVAERAWQKARAEVEQTRQWRKGRPLEVAR